MKTMGMSCESTPIHYRVINQLTRLYRGICQTVMGPRPSDTLTNNLRPGNPDPGSSSDEYRGCIASLPHSMENVTAARVESQVDQNCRAKGLEPGSPELLLIWSADASGVLHSCWRMRRTIPCNEWSRERAA